jgi:hypothetical protein
MAMGSIRAGSIRAAAPLVRVSRAGLRGEEKVKGSHIVRMSEWIEEHLGEGAFARLAGNRWGVIVPVGWYEFDEVHEILLEASRRAGKSVQEIAREIGRLNAERDLTSIYRFFLRIAQPQRVLGYGPRLWRTYVTFGEAVEVTNDKGHFIGQGTGFTQRQIDWACGVWEGFVPTAVRLCGGKNITPPAMKTWCSEKQVFSLQLELRYS